MPLTVTTLVSPLLQAASKICLSDGSLVVVSANASAALITNLKSSVQNCGLKILDITDCSPPAGGVTATLCQGLIELDALEVNYECLEGEVTASCSETQLNPSLRTGIIVGVVLLLLLAAGVGGYCYYRHRKPSTSTERGLRQRLLPPVNPESSRVEEGDAGRENNPFASL